MRSILFLFWGSVLFFQCSSTSPYDHITDEKVKSVLTKGIQAAGGLEHWRSDNAYTFDKRSILYLEDGSIESKNQQIVTFKNHPELEGTILWNNRTDSVETKIVFSDGKATKFIAGIAQSDEMNTSATLSFYGAHMVMNLPFKLLDPGVQLSYGGRQEMHERTVEVIIADYNKEQPNHNKTHRWWHYFDVDTYQYIGYKVFHPPTYALVENLEHTMHEGISYASDRITWRVDSLDNKQYIRAKFAYDNFRAAD